MIQWVRHLGQLGRRLGWRGLVVAGVGGYLLSGTFFVPASQQAVVLVLGRVEHAHVSPGLHWTWPRPLGQVIRLKVREAKRLTVGFEAPERVLGRQAWPVQSQFLTGDRNLIAVRAVVQYAIRNPVSYLFQHQATESLMATTVEESLAAVVRRRPVEDLLTTERVAVQQAVKSLSQKALDAHGAGISVLSLHLESVAPPEDVRGAFNDALSAREDRDRLVREAQSYANRRLPIARGEARRLLEEARGYRQRVVAESKGDAARFLSLAAEYKRLPKETATRLYLEALEEILPRMDITIVEGESRGVDLDFVQNPGQEPRP